MVLIVQTTVRAVFRKIHQFRYLQELVEDSLPVATVNDGNTSMTIEDIGHLIAHGSYQEPFEAFNNLYNQE